MSVSMAMSIDTHPYTPQRPSRGLKRKGDESSVHLAALVRDDSPTHTTTAAFTNITTNTATQTLTEDIQSILKHQKLIHSTVDDSKCTRVKFAPGIILNTKKLYQEPWGVMVSSLEDYPPLQIQIGNRYWAKWDGMSCPYSCRPILQAIHSVADASQVFDSAKR